MSYEEECNVLLGMRKSYPMKDNTFYGQRTSGRVGVFR